MLLPTRQELGRGAYKHHSYKTPDEVGFAPMKNWDTTIIRQLTVKLYVVSYCQKGMLEVLYRNELSYTRPTYSLVNADPVKQEEFKKEFGLLKKSNRRER